MSVKPANNIEVRDEGVSQGFVRAVDFVGSGVSATVSGSVATVTVSGGGGGGFSVTQIERDLGSTAAWRGVFTITDASISAASRLSVWQAPGPYTGKGTRADECEMDWIQCHAVPASGTATVHWRAVQSFSGDSGHMQTRSGRAGVIGRVRGNIKFYYAIGA